MCPPFIYIDGCQACATLEKQPLIIGNELMQHAEIVFLVSPLGGSLIIYLLVAWQKHSPSGNSVSFDDVKKMMAVCRYFRLCRRRMHNTANVRTTVAAESLLWRILKCHVWQRKNWRKFAKRCSRCVARIFASILRCFRMLDVRQQTKTVPAR